MNHKLLFVSLSAALALGGVATAVAAAPASGLSDARAADGSKLLHAVHDDDDYRVGREVARNGDGEVPQVVVIL